MSSYAIDMPTKPSFADVEVIRRIDPWAHPEADAILEGDEFDMVWWIGLVSIDSLSRFDGYLCREKQEAVEQLTTVAAMSAVMLNNPPLFFATPHGEWKLLDGQHRLTRARVLGMVVVPVAFAVAP